MSFPSGLCGPGSSMWIPFLRSRPHTQDRRTGLEPITRSLESGVVMETGPPTSAAMLCCTKVFSTSDSLHSHSVNSFTVIQHKCIRRKPTGTGKNISVIRAGLRAAAGDRSEERPDRADRASDTTAFQASEGKQRRPPLAPWQLSHGEVSCGDGVAEGRCAAAVDASLKKESAAPYPNFLAISSSSEGVSSAALLPGALAMLMSRSSPPAWVTVTDHVVEVEPLEANKAMSSSRASEMLSRRSCADNVAFRPPAARRPPPGSPTMTVLAELFAIVRRRLELQ
ncbi:hypothetical protein EYF80_021943 [Liparis tanakae]|uniref:Uncharacterized protein n=1 Tax=Liparis tanakae TaxID=230148 RepID=A0A4Z2HPM3_9TELE|nr:hypothetical protein EYF80_021943 [Liparis tanakae]